MGGVMFGGEGVRVRGELREGRVYVAWGYRRSML